MSLEAYTRANEFDRRVGMLQTRKVIDLANGKSLLDIGCGVGEYTPIFLERFDRVVGLDPSEDFLKEARVKDPRVEYVQGYGETFSIDEKFDTISMNNILEHVEDPVALLKNCKKHLNRNGWIIAQVPNSRSVARRLGVSMGVIDSLNHISDKERDFYGHKRVYNLTTLRLDCEHAGLKVVGWGGLLYKPLPNEMLEKLCQEQGVEWTNKFINALVEYGKKRPDECACIYTICE